MRLPFTRDQFLEVFRSYNDAIGIAPLLLVALAVSVLMLAHSQRAWRHRAIAGALATLWLWAGVVYHWGFFAGINPAARLFGALFVIQAAVLIVHGVARARVRFDPRHSRAAIIGWMLIVYALVAYPVLGLVLGHGYPNGPSFGVPCPITLYFFGTMFWVVGGAPLAVTLIPLVWAAIATSAAVVLGIYEDGALAIGALLLIADFIRRRLATRVPNVVLAGRNDAI